MTGKRRQQPLTREELVDAALRIVDTEGLDALTMRHLAEAVGVEAMSLYHHVPNKESLLDWTVERMRSEAKPPDPVPEDWADVLAAIFEEYRRVLCVHPNMLPLATRAPAGAGLSGLDFLVERGLSRKDAVELYQSLVAFTVGFALLGARHDHVDTTALGALEAEWMDETSRRTMRAIIDGYRTRAAPAKKRG